MGLRSLLAVAALMAALALAWILVAGRAREPAPPASPAGDSAKTPEALDAPPSSAPRISLDPVPPPELDREREGVGREAPSVTLPLPEAFLDIVAIRADNRAPVEGAEITVDSDRWRELSEWEDAWIALKPEQYRSSGRRSPGYPHPTTDEAGVRELTVPSGLQLIVRVSSGEPTGDVGPGFVDLEPLLPGELRTVTISLPAGLDRQFHGRLVDTNGNPIAGAHVSLIEARALSTQIESDGAGHFRLSTRSWTNPQAVIDSAAHALHRVRLEPGHEELEHALEVVLIPAPLVEGQVFDLAGQPAARVFIEASPGWSEWPFADPERAKLGVRRLGRETALPSPWKAETDSDGRYRMERLPVGEELVVTARLADGSAPDQSRTVYLEPGERKSLDFLFSEGITVRGRVVDQEGKPVAGAPIEAIEPWEEFADARLGTVASIPNSSIFEAIATAGADDEGRFALEAMPAGRWLIGVQPFSSRGGMEPIYEVTPDLYPPLYVLVELSQNAPPGEVELMVHRGLAISGQVVDPEGSPADCLVLVQPEEGFGFGLFAGVTGGRRGENQGRFEVGPLQPGVYQIWASGDLFPDSGPSATDSEIAIAEAGASGVLLRRRASGWIAGMVDAGDRSFEEIQVTARQGSKGFYFSQTGFAKGTVGPDGSFRLEPLTPGSYRVVATADGEWMGWAGDVIVPEGGASAPCRIELRPTGEVRVVLQGVAPAETDDFTLTVSPLDEWLGDAEFERDGVALLRLPVGDPFELRVEHSGRFVTSQTITASSDHPTVVEVVVPR